ncbi:cytochrome P450 6g1-like [Pieris rapae]|uniref:cytochrome P450 6g1-like n=1 Tax=Pieris rapae TaxID=64459 RepID=UPI001E28113F|nr:cytochrome P450 6g1-like [Pieris rapae]
MISLVLIFCALLYLIIYFIGKNNELYWKKRNVAFYTKNKVTGIMWDFLTKDTPLFKTVCEVYKEYRNEPAVGIGSFLTPSLYVIDLNNIQHILSSEFHSFHYRGLDTNKKDLLADNVLFMKGNRWKLMRQNMTPLFTPTKLKAMFYIVDKSARDFVIHLENNPMLLKGNAFNTISSFCSAAISAAVFGVTAKSIFDSPFLMVAKKSFNSTFIKDLKFVIGIFSNRLFELLGFTMFHDHEKFFINTIKQVLRERQSSNVKKHDFVDLCVNIQNSGDLLDKETGYKITPTDEILAAQAFFFFVGGVEPTTSAMFTTLVELGKNPKILERLQNEIDETFRKNNNELSYELVMNMIYLDMVLSEALRMHPPIAFLMRRCVRDSVLPVGNIKIENGTKIFIPLYERHHDEKHFPEPEVFNPERFSPENRHKINDLTYTPFGKGNRQCIGTRFALLQTKTGLIHLLHNFSVKTLIKDGGIKHRREQLQVRLDNVDLEFIPRRKKI